MDKLERRILEFLLDFFTHHNHRIFYYNDIVLLSEYCYYKAVEFDELSDQYLLVLNELLSLNIIPYNDKTMICISEGLNQIISDEKQKNQLTADQIDKIEQLLMLI